MIYLASPYSSPNPALQNRRAREAERFVVRQFNLGVAIFSPIVYCHNLATVHNLPGSAEFWKFFNDEMLTRCSEVWVLTLDGWQESLGVRHEIAKAESLQMAVIHKEPLPYG